MRARLLQAWGALRESYWFLPAVFSVGAMLLAAGSIAIDAAYGPWDISWLPGSSPDGARAVLSTVAGSLITVAGVAISVTLVALSTTSSAFGPRILTLFLRDRGVQSALGVFAGSFLFCLVVLLFVRSPLETADATPFVPQLALLAGFTTGLTSIGAFLFLVHHVSQMLHVDNVVARAGADLLGGVEDLIGRRKEDGVTPIDTDPEVTRDEGGAIVRADRDGYLQVVDEGSLLELAERWSRVIVLEVRRGEFVTRERVIARVWPGDGLGEDDLEEVLSGFAWGQRRNHGQEVRFQVDQIVQIAARALSPGINDPFTAMSCIDWLEAALKRFSEVPSARWLSQVRDGEPRLYQPATTFADLLEASVGQLVPYAASDLNAARHLARALDRLAQDCGRADCRSLLEERADQLLDACRVRLPD
ncbi:MAG: DUF2254 domain-containing protein, partial [Gemmatimonadetes bacterium]|nr:DUF2254 domain-containing protein [Gemmatimonadota bacterium]